MTAQHRAHSVSDILRIIKAFEPRQAEPAMATLRIGLHGLSRSYAEKPDKEKAYINTRFAKVIAAGDRHQKLLGASLLHEVTSAYEPLAKAAYWLRNWDMGLTERYHAWHYFMALPFDRVHRFSPFQRAKLNRHARRIYMRLFEDADRGLSLNLTSLPKPQKNRRRVALSVAQFLGPRHAPTAAVMRMAKQLQMRGFEAKIFNLNHIPTRTGSAFYTPCLASVLDVFNGQKTIDLKDGIEAYFWQNRHYGLTQKSFDVFLDEVSDFAPDVWITLGPGNLYADLITSRIPSISMPMTSSLCIGLPGAYGSVEPPSDLDIRLLAGVGITPEQTVDIPNGFALPPSGEPINRKQFGLKREDFAVAIVSNRPEHDLPPPYLDQLEALCQAAPTLRLRGFGAVPKHVDWTKHPHLSKKMVHCGFASDLFASLSGFDAVLNPPRQGGGTSAAFAMALGIPVFSLGGCDVATLVGEDFIWPDYERLLNDLADLAKAGPNEGLKQKAKARWKIISDLDGQLDALIAGAQVRP